MSTQIRKVLDALEIGVIYGAVGFVIEWAFGVDLPLISLVVAGSAGCSN